MLRARLDERQRPGPDRLDAAGGAPVPERFDDFARLAAEVARRYPDVRYYVVWNEFKGFWRPAGNRWDHEGYTRLYNKVYSALKSVNPRLKVGGPYMVMNSDAPSPGHLSAVSGPWGGIDQRALDAVEYWFKNKKGADFVVVDGHTFPVQRQVRPNEFEALGKFSTVTRWLHDLDGRLPVWWAEWYVEPDDSGWSDRRRSAVHAAAMIEFARSGTATALYWSPQRRTVSGSCPGCLWTGLADPGGGRAGSTLDLLQNFAAWFPPGTELLDVRVSTDRVRVLAQRKKMIVVNTRPEPARLTADGRSLNLAPYEVRWLDR